VSTRYGSVFAASATDPTKEYRALVVREPPVGTFALAEDGTYTYVGVDTDFDYQLYIDGVLPDSGETFSYFYPDSEQSLSVVPEPSAVVLAGLGLAAVFWSRRVRRK